MTSSHDSIENAHRGTWRTLRVGFDAAAERLPQDDGIAVLGVIDPVQQLGAPDGLLADIAREIGERLARVAQKLET